jgi:membrane protein
MPSSLPESTPGPTEGSDLPAARTTPQSSSDGGRPVVLASQRHRHVWEPAEHVWVRVSQSPLHTLWDFHGASVSLVWKRTLKAMMSDNLLSRAAEMGYYFLFALFPTLICASSILGLAARQASSIYDSLLHYLALVVPASAYTMVIETFNQTAAHATTGKITLGLVAALWSASVGFAAIQDGMNTVYRVQETRPYWKARGSAILVTVLLSLMVSINLGVLLGGDVLARLMYLKIWHHALAMSAALAIHFVQWTVAIALLVVQFSTIYYFAPNLTAKRWYWTTPGAMIGIFGWVAASLGLRVYLHYFNSFSVTYGSLGAVIALLTWFYLTGLMLLLGAEVNSEVQAAVIENRLRAEAVHSDRASL